MVVVVGPVNLWAEPYFTDLHQPAPFFSPGFSFYYIWEILLRILHLQLLKNKRKSFANLELLSRSGDVGNNP